MLAIKLQRIGKKHQPSYRVVVAEKREKMAAPPVEDLGSYNSFGKKLEVKSERVAHWIKMGAQPTATVHNLLVKAGVLKTAKMAVKMKRVIANNANAEANIANTENKKEEVATDNGANAEAKKTE